VSGRRCREGGVGKEALGKRHQQYHDHDFFTDYGSCMRAEIGILSPAARYQPSALSALATVVEYLVSDDTNCLPSLKAKAQQRKRIQRLKEVQSRAEQSLVISRLLGSAGIHRIRMLSSLAQLRAVEGRRKRK
jgi:hypothetical protein